MSKSLPSRISIESDVTAVVRVDRAVRNRAGLADEVELRHQEVRRGPRGKRQRDDGLSIGVDRDGRIERRGVDRGRPVLAGIALIALVTLVALRALGAVRACRTLCACRPAGPCAPAGPVAPSRRPHQRHRLRRHACGTGRTGRPCGPTRRQDPADRALRRTCRPLRTVRAMAPLRARSAVRPGEPWSPLQTVRHRRTSRARSRPSRRPMRRPPSPR